MTNKEVWCPIPGHVGYEASSLGRARSVTRQIITCAGVVRMLPGKILQCMLDKQTGYLRVPLGRGVRMTPVGVYVLKAFVGECPDGQECLHKNNDKIDNRLINLSWGTRSCNNLDRVRHGIHPNAIRVVCPCNHPLFPPNLRPKKHSYRECLACSRAHSFVNRQSLTKSKIGEVAFKAIADRYYYQIMEAA